MFSLKPLETLELTHTPSSMMMKNLYETFTKTSNLINSQTPIHLNNLNPFCISLFSTKIPSSYDPQSQFQDQIHNYEQSNEKNLKKPSQIPFQSKIANWVNLMGSIKMPVKFLTCDDGTPWAGTVISQEQFSSNLPLLWIPIIFKGDLAYTAMMHFKENDMVYVNGNLTTDLLPIDLTMDQRSLQVLVHDVHFVRGMKNPFVKCSGLRS